MAKKSEKPAKKTTKKAAQEPALIGPNTVITITVPAKDAQAAYDKALRRLSQNVKSSGFRAGKVPLSLAEKQIGSETIIEHALELVVPPLYEQEMQGKDIKPLTRPELKAVSLEKGNDWTVEIHLAEKPTINLKGYQKAVAAGKKAAKEELKKQKAELKKHMESTKDHEGHNHTLPSEEDVTLTNIYQQLVTSIKPTLPELLVKEEVRADLQNLVQRLESLNLKLDDYLKQQGMQYDDLTNQLAISALGRLQLMFILEAIAAEEKITVSDEEVTAEIEKTQDADTKKQQLADDRYKSYLRQTLKRDKLAQYLLNQ